MIQILEWFFGPKKDPNVHQAALRQNDGLFYGKIR